jgi:NADH-quinone oxidoreductase subunit L
MFLAMGVGAFGAGIFHLYTHAFFKALLFLGSGAVIHALHGEQDMRRMGGLRRDLPITYWTFLIGALAIAGVPGLAGFFSKDEILFKTFAGGHTLLWTVGIVTSLLTAIYMFRVVFLTFFGERTAAPATRREAPGTQHPEHPTPSTQHPIPGIEHPSPSTYHTTPVHDAPPAMAFALIVLAIGSVIAGYVGLGGRFEHFLAPSFAPEAAEAATDSGLELTLMVVSSLVAVAGIAIAVYFFVRNRAAAAGVADRFGGLHRVLLNKYYVDDVYDAAIVQPIRIISQEGLWKGVDTRLIDATVNGVAGTVGGLSSELRKAQTGSVRTYAASLFLGVVAILGYYLWK